MRANGLNKRPFKELPAETTDPPERRIGFRADSTIGNSGPLTAFSVGCADGALSTADRSSVRTQKNSRTAESAARMTAWFALPHSFLAFRSF
jgi:hypothetical protein